MTDSTPSQTQSNVSSEAFEALIDLLATDGIDDSEQPTTLPGARTRSQANMTLRDESGRLDFDKIRLMFAAQPDNPLVLDNGESLRGAGNTQHSMRRSEEGDSDDEVLTSHRSTPAAIASPPPQPSVGQGTTGGGHRRSSTFGNEQWVGQGIADIGRGAHDEALPLGLIPDQPLSFDELNNALTSAHAEVKTLREQYDELHALVSKHFGHQTKDFDSNKPQTGLSDVHVDDQQVKHDPPPEKESELIEPHVATSDPPAQSDEAVPAASDIPSEVSSLTENEAKEALATLITRLNFSPPAIASLVSATSSPSPPPIHGQHDTNSLSRAAKFVNVVDELVWRRSVSSPGARSLHPVFSEENIDSLLSRLELWERAVRRSSRT